MKLMGLVILEVPHNWGLNQIIDLWGVTKIRALLWTNTEKEKGIKKRTHNPEALMTF